MKELPLQPTRTSESTPEVNLEAARELLELRSKVKGLIEDLQDEDRRTLTGPQGSAWIVGEDGRRGLWQLAHTTDSHNVADVANRVILRMMDRIVAFDTALHSYMADFPDIVAELEQERARERGSNE